MQRKSRQRTIKQATYKILIAVYSAFFLMIACAGLITDLGYNDYLRWNNNKSGFGLFLILCPFTLLLLYIKEIHNGIYSLTTKLR